MEPSTPRWHGLRDLTTVVRRAVLRRRRLLAVLLTVTAVAAGLRAAAPPEPETVPLVVAATDLPAGAVVEAADVTTVDVPPDAAPADPLDDPVGTTLAGPLGVGEPLTTRRVLGSALASADPRTTAVPVRLGDADQAALLRVGMEIELFATDPQGGATTSLAQAVTVLGVPAAGGSGGAPNGAGATPGRVVVLAVPHEQVAAVTAATVTSYVTFAWSGG